MVDLVEILTADPDEERDRKLATLADLDEAREAMLARDWARSRAALERMLEAGPDKVASLLLRRLDSLEKDPPGPDWDGSARLTDK